MAKLLKWISDHLLYFVLIVGCFSLFFPQLGSNNEVKYFISYPFSLLCSGPNDILANYGKDNY